MGLQQFRSQQLARFCAIGMVLLVISPWTAPFATCDPRPASGLASGSAAVSQSAVSSASVADEPDSAMASPEFRLERQRAGHAANPSFIVVEPASATTQNPAYSLRSSPLDNHTIASSILRL
jgi:hypothetical protein